MNTLQQEIDRGVAQALNRINTLYDIDRKNLIKIKAWQGVTERERILTVMMDKMIHRIERERESYNYINF